MTEDNSDETLVADLLARFAKLTDWEQSFVTDLQERLEGGRDLTERQRETLEKIWEERT